MGNEDGLLYDIKHNQDGSYWSLKYKYLPEPIQIMENVKRVFMHRKMAGDLVVLIIKTDDNLWGWGANTAGVFADGTFHLSEEEAETYTYEKPKHILDNVVYVDANSEYVAAILQDSTLWGWGYNYEQLIEPVDDIESLKDATTVEEAKNLIIPNPTLMMKDISSIKAGGRTNIALKTDGSFWCWGRVEQKPNDDPEQKKKTITTVITEPFEFIDSSGNWVSDIIKPADISFVSGNDETKAESTEIAVPKESDATAGPDESIESAELPATENEVPSTENTELINSGNSTTSNVVILVASLVALAVIIGTIVTIRKRRS